MHFKVQLEFLWEPTGDGPAQVAPPEVTRLFIDALLGVTKVTLRKPPKGQGVKFFRQNREAVYLTELYICYTSYLRF